MGKEVNITIKSCDFRLKSYLFYGMCCVFYYKIL